MGFLLFWDDWTHKLQGQTLKNTLPETNIAPENGWLEDDVPFGARPIFRGELLNFGGVEVPNGFEDLVFHVIFLHKS